MRYENSTAVKDESKTVLKETKRWMCNETQECSKSFVKCKCMFLNDLIEQRFLWQASEWVGFLSWEIIKVNIIITIN